MITHILMVLFQLFYFELKNIIFWIIFFLKKDEKFFGFLCTAAKTHQTREVGSTNNVNN
jgi:hypothetical protein